MIDLAVLTAFDAAAFRERQPFPWQGFHGFLTPEAFRALSAAFPRVERFDWHQDRPRRDGQRPHNRYYLALERRGARDEYGAGTIRLDEVAPCWRGLIEELRTCRAYRALLEAALGTSAFEWHFTWHIGVTGSEVSPHVDSRVKAGTHLLYFNTTEDWRPEWGGATILLGDKRHGVTNPDFADFASSTEVDTLGNRSFLFRNQPEAWHGVKALACPPGRHRRLFNVILEHPRVRKTWWSRWRDRRRARAAEAPS